MYCIIKCIVQGKQARVKNADLRHPSCTVVMQKRKSASPVLNVIILSVFLKIFHMSLGLLNIICVINVIISFFSISY